MNHNSLPTSPSNLALLIVSLLFFACTDPPIQTISDTPLPSTPTPATPPPATSTPDTPPPSTPPPSTPTPDTPTPDTPIPCVDKDQDEHCSGASDCNDTDPNVYAGALEQCNHLDDDCDLAIDEGVTQTYYFDADTDTYGIASVTTQACTQPAGYAAQAGDCNDEDATIHPGATELPSDSVDQNCDTKELCYQDIDGDGYRPPTESTTSSADLDCTDTGEASSTLPATDCNDRSSTIHPGATELCDGVDNNCDGATDSSCWDAARWDQGRWGP